jgi:hypothetical protein
MNIQFRSGPSAVLDKTADQPPHSATQARNGLGITATVMERSDAQYVSMNEQENAR